MCQQSLPGYTRVPVCSRCLSDLEPLAAEYFCNLCRTPFQSEKSLDASGQCALCRAGTRDFDAAYCYGAYEGKLRDLIHLLKYARMKPLAKPLGKRLLSALPREEKLDVIIPVPMHWWKRWNRGFNQSQRLAQTLADRCGLPLDITSLRRRGGKRSQAGLSHAERRTNVSGMFYVPKGTSLTGKRVLLVDDVFTTGATATACAKALKKAGASSVVLLTLAHVDRRWAVVSAGENPSGVSQDGYFDQTAETGIGSQRELRTD